MKTIVNRAVGLGVLYSFILLIVVSGLHFVAFPLTSWSELWERTVFELPFVLFVPVVTTLLGATVGMVVALYWKRQVDRLENIVGSITEDANSKVDVPESSSSEFIPIIQKVHKVQQYIQEQTKRNQKLISERVEDQEQQMEKVISDERNRLARELHDSVSQELFAASMMISAINEAGQDGNDQTTKLLNQLEKMIQQAQLEMRALLLHLRPIALKDKSLAEGMKQLLEELKQKIPIDITWKMEQVKLSRGVEDHLFRILQESVSNTLRHANANTLDILLIERENVVILRVVDDGVGFDVKKTQAGSYGLINIKERAAEIGANLRIISVPNEGTRLEVRVPILDAEGDSDD